jgi:hypothetical protein
MIALKEQEPFGRGSHREVYRHPDGADRCLKVMTGDWRNCDRRKRAGWLSRALRPKWYFHESLSELHFSEELRKRVGEKAWDFVAQSRGMVATDLGEALEVDLVNDHDGKISLSLKAYLLKFGMTAECREGIEYFWDGVVRYGIFLQGRPDNVSVRIGRNGDCLLIAIDGFGLPQAIPLAKWFGFARARFLRKRRAKQDKAIAGILAARESGEDFGGKGMILD